MCMDKLLKQIGSLAQAASKVFSMATIHSYYTWISPYKYCAKLCNYAASLAHYACTPSLGEDTTGRGPTIPAPRSCAHVLLLFCH